MTHAERTSERSSTSNADGQPLQMAAAGEKGAGRWIVLVYAELTCCFVAMSVVAWLRYPARSDDYRLAMGRFFFPVAAIILFAAAVLGIHQPTPPASLGWLIGAGVAAVITAARALVEVRHYQRRRLARTSKRLRKR